MHTTNLDPAPGPAGVAPAPAGPDAPAGLPAAAVLTCGFGAAVVMWALGYLGRLPGVEAPAWTLGALYLAASVAAGAWTGRLPGATAWSAAGAGAVAFALNLLILGSVVRDRADLALAVPGSILAGAALAGIGGLAARRLAPPPAVAPATAADWVGRFAGVAAAATLLLLAIGGLVTTHDAGLAVPDWPNSYGTNMFLFPLSRMTGGIFYEHAHRLFGSLVGLTTLGLLALTWRHERRRPVLLLTALAFALVCVQGALGGLRVTGRLTLSMDAAELSPSTALAVVHGVLGQLFFALLAGLAAVGSGTWRSERPAAPREADDRELHAWLVAAVALQLVLGALVRHTGMTPVLHICMAVLVALLAGFAGFRAWALAGDLPVLPGLGRFLLGAVGLQLLLGIGALVVTELGRDGASPPGRILLPTAHQTLGALILVAATQLLLWSRRLVRPAPPAGGAPPGAASA